MSDYFQPDFYRFNEDSLRLVQFIKGRGLLVRSLLDLGAGCGVIGIEVANHLRPENLTLLEHQEDFFPHLLHNREHQLKVPLECEIIKASFEEWEPACKYDLIACNPPYYLPGHGQPNKDPRREIARSFVKDNWMILLRLIESVLAPGGTAFFVIKNDLLILKEIIKNSGTLTVSYFPERDLIFLEITLSENFNGIG